MRWAALEGDGAAPLPGGAVAPVTSNTAAAAVKVIFLTFSLVQCFVTKGITRIKKYTIWVVFSV